MVSCRNTQFSETLRVGGGKLSDVRHTPVSPVMISWLKVISTRKASGSKTLPTFIKIYKSRIRHCRKVFTVKSLFFHLTVVFSFFHKDPTCDKCLWLNSTVLHYDFWNYDMEIFQLCAHWSCILKAPFCIMIFEILTLKTPTLCTIDFAI